MSGTFHRRFKVLLAAAAGAFACWQWMPGTTADRAAFEAACRSFANPPFFISGGGSHENPWQLRTFSAVRKADPRQAPVVVSLGDDVDGFFQSSPPSPIDMAVILKNFRRLGATKAATAAVLAWDAPEPIELAALDKEIARFDSLVMAAPLSRGAAPETMPPAFRRASISLERIHGDTSYLPVVNRIPLSGVILGGDHTLAGFQSLDTEKNGDLPPLLARWEDRVVLAFPLLTVVQRLGLAAGDVDVLLGSYLKLGPDGPTVPIDRFGRLSMPPGSAAARTAIPAESLIQGENLFPKDAPPPVILRDDRSAAEPATRAFSAGLPAMIAAIASDGGLTAITSYHRLSARAEVITLSAVLLAIALVCALPAFTRNIGFLTITAICLAAQLIGAGAAAAWLPCLPALAAVLIAALVSAATRSAPAVAQPAAQPPPREKKSKPAEETPAATPVEKTEPVKTPELPAAKPTPKNPPSKKAGQRGKKRRR